MDIDVHSLVADFLFPALIGFALLVGYFVGLRPILRQTPALSVLYDREESYFAAVAGKFSGLKQKLVTLFISLAGFVVLAHDQITPLITQAGVDPSQVLPKVPAWAWPFITMAILWLVQYFRNLADKQAQANAVALLNAGQPLAAPAPGIPVSTPPSPAFNLPDKPGA